MLEGVYLAFKKINYFLKYVDVFRKFLLFTNVSLTPILFADHGQSGTHLTIHGAFPPFWLLEFATFNGAFAFSTTSRELPTPAFYAIFVVVLFVGVGVRKRGESAAILF